MCLIVVLFKIVPEFPLIVGANRDENYARTGEAPRRWDGTPGIHAGRDPVGGGTWLGANSHGLVVALANRRAGVTENPTYRSRGLICLDALHATDTVTAIERADSALRLNHYNPFNLLCADCRRVVVLYHSGDGDSVEELPPGIHVLTTGNANDTNLPKIARAHSLLAKRRMHDLREAVETLKAVCRDHGDGGPGADTLCMHGERTGTVSSSILVVNSKGKLEYYWHAQSRPCCGEYERVHLEGI